MKWSGKSSLREHLFRVGVLLKGIDGTIEFCVGIAAWAIKPIVIVHIVAVLSQDADTTHDIVLRFLRHETQRVLFVSKHFLAFYLVGHGVAKIFAVGALIRNKLWAYPVAMMVFGVFIVYETYRSFATHGVGLMALTAFDVIVVILIWFEYQAQKAGHRSPFAQD